MVARVAPEERSPALPATSPKLLSRQGTPAAESSETVYAAVSPNVCRRVTTPVTARITVTILVVLILFLLNCRKTDLMMRSISNVVGVTPETAVRGLAPIWLPLFLRCANDGHLSGPV